LCVDSNEIRGLDARYRALTGSGLGFSIPFPNAFPEISNALVFGPDRPDKSILVAIDYYGSALFEDETGYHVESLVEMDSNRPRLSGAIRNAISAQMGEPSFPPLATLTGTRDDVEAAIPIRNRAAFAAKRAAHIALGQSDLQATVVWETIQSIASQTKASWWIAHKDDRYDAEYWEAIWEPRLREMFNRLMGFPRLG
jgi:hypothetical protein